MTTPFIPFGRSHLIVLALTFCVPLVLSAAVRYNHNQHIDRVIRSVFATLLIVAELVWLRLLYRMGWMWVGNVLPMQLCDWAAIATVVTLIWPVRRSYELAYFWAFSGTLQALLTPDLAVDFPDLRFVVFFVFHGGVIAAVLYLMFGTGLRPTLASIPRVIAWTFGYALVAFVLNARLGTNYGFLAAKPPTASLLSYLGPWPVYIAELVPIGLAFVLILYAPFFLSDQIWRRH